MATATAAIEQRGWAAQPRQSDFLHATEDIVLYGGAAGGGKTDALLVDLIRCCVRHKGAKTLFIRRTYRDLAEPGAAIDRSKELLRGTGPVYRESDFAWEFPGGSRLQFGHLDNDRALDSYQGAQPARIAIDELTQFPEHYVWFLYARLRTSIPGLRPVLRGGTNPGGIGHGWVKRTLIDPAPTGGAFTVARGATEVAARFIPARLEDNPALLANNPSYAAKLEALPDELRRAYRYGDWDVFAGQFFGEWRRDLHVCAPFAIPLAWPRWRAIDFGYGAPFCCLWLARDPDTRRVYVYRELYEAGITDAVQAQAIVAVSAGEPIRFSVADPSMWSKQPNGTSVADTYALRGIALTPANNDRRKGWQEVHTALNAEDGPPILQVFSTCTELIRTLPEQIHDKLDVEDLDTHGEDHAADALRYSLMALSSFSAARTERPSQGYAIGQAARQPVRSGRGRW